MRKNNETTLKQAIDDVFDSLRLKDKFYEYKLISNWEKCMGTTISRRTTNIYIKDKTLFVQVDSSTLRQELLMARSKVVDTMNASVGSDIISDVVFN